MADRGGTVTLRTALLLGSPRRLPNTLRNVALWRRLRGDANAAAVWKQFYDDAEYLRSHPDVAEAGVDPEIHFLLCANEEYRDPSDRFDIRYYLTQYPEVARSGVNALLHYALFGHGEKRNPHPYADGWSSEWGTDAAGRPVVEVDNTWPADRPLVSVVIPCFNYGRYVEQALRSVLDQTFKNLEVIVVEGGSTDAETVEEVRRLEALGLPKTRFYYRSSRCLAGDNRNFGIERALGRYVCCLDADDVLRPIYLETAVFYAEVLGYDIVSPSMECFGDSSLVWRVRDATFAMELEENHISTVALFRRNAWQQVGGFRDWGTGAGHVPEDWDLWIRLLGQGFRSKAIREPLALYRVHGSSLSRTAELELSEQRDHLHEANAELIGSFREDRVAARSVINPHVNLGPVEDIPGVLFALPYLTIGGAEHLFRSIGRGVIDRGQRLVVITSLTLAGAAPPYDSCFDGITNHVYHLSRLCAHYAARREFLWYLLRRYRTRTLVLAGSEFVYHALPDLARDFPDVAVVDQLFNDAVHVRNNRRYAPYIGATVVPSEPLRDSLVQRHGADPASIYVIPHGIELPADAAADPHALPPESRGKVIVGFFGRLSEEKGPDLFVEIARRLAGRGDLYFVMTGEGPEREKVMSQIRKHGLERCIYAPGFVREVLPLMRSADMVVLPSRIDGMPLAVLEAQAIGKPVIASRVGSLPSMVADGESGFLCGIGDVNAFCARIELLAGDRRLRERMGAAGSERVRREYSAERMLDAYFRAFTSVERQACYASKEDR